MSEKYNTWLQNVVDWKWKVAENGNTEVRHLKAGAYDANVHLKSDTLRLLLTFLLFARMTKVIIWHKMTQVWLLSTFYNTVYYVTLHYWLYINYTQSELKHTHMWRCNQTHGSSLCVTLSHFSGSMDKCPFKRWTAADQQQHYVTDMCETQLSLPLSPNTAIIFVRRNPMINKCESRETVNSGE